MIFKRELLKRARDLDLDVLPDDKTASKILLGLKGLYDYFRDQAFAQSALERKFSSVSLYNRASLFPVQTYIARSITKVPFKGVEEALIRLFPKHGKGTFYHLASLATINGLILVSAEQTFYNFANDKLERKQVFSLEHGDRARYLIKQIKQKLICPTPYFLFKFGFWYGANPSYWLPAPFEHGGLQKLIGRALRGNTPAEIAYDWVYLIGQPIPAIDIGPILTAILEITYTFQSIMPTMISHFNENLLLS